MTLRRRLVASAVLVALLVATGTWLAGNSQRNYVESELDARLSTLMPAARVAVKRDSSGARTPRALGALISDAWVGTLDSEGLTTVIAPLDNPQWAPVFGMADVSSQALTVPANNGGTARVRSAFDGRGGRIIVALPTARGEETIARLQRASAFLAIFVMALLAAMVWWVNSLGIAPIARMTDAARRIASGHTDSVVPTDKGDAEAIQLGEALNTMISTLRSSDERIRQFVADASHELRTPLTTLRGYSDLYESGALRNDEMVADAMRRIRSEADRMTRIIDDLIQLRGIDRLTPVHGPCRIDLVVSECAADLMVTHHPRTIAVFAEEVTISCDRHLVTQAVMALGTNAMEHTPVDTNVTVTARSIPGAVRVSVHDDGPGIPREHLDRLFERLYRVDPARGGDRNNSGIGLSIVAAIVAAHGGSHGVDSSPGAGTTFWFDLPYRPVSPTLP